MSEDMAPVMIQVPLEGLREIHAALIECGQDLQCSVDAEYAHQMDCPSGQRRHARDRVPASRAIHLAQAMQAWFGFTPSPKGGENNS